MADSKIIPLTEEDKQQWVQGISEISHTMIPADSRDNAPHKHVYVVAFDGTWNDRNHLPPNSTPTNPALLEAELSKHYDGNKLDGHYYPGVGTSSNPFTHLMEGMTGHGARNIAEQAYSDFNAKSQQWIAQDPQANIEVVAMGFSRGAATARHFLNLVDERGVTRETPVVKSLSNAFAGDGMPLVTEKVSEGHLREPGSVHSEALLFDTVATGQEAVLKLGIPPSTDYVVHLTARDEERLSFPLVPVVQPGQDPNHTRFLEVSLPGAHSDIGGSYPEGVDKMAKYAGEIVLNRYGLPITPAPHPPLEALNEGRHNSDWPDTPFTQKVASALGQEGRRTVEETNPILAGADKLGMLIREGYDRVALFADKLEEAHATGTNPVNEVAVQLTRDREGNIQVQSTDPNVHLDAAGNTLIVDGAKLNLDKETLHNIATSDGVVLTFDRTELDAKRQAQAADEQAKPEQPPAEETVAMGM